jgi:hypothetical protein
MAMTEAFRNLLLTYGGTQITHIGLVDDNGDEISGGDPAYARVAVTWAAAGSGAIRPNADLTFNIPASTTVGGWRGFTAATEGTNHGGAALTPEVYAGQGQYKLLAASTGILASDPA